MLCIKLFIDFVSVFLSKNTRFLLFSQETVSEHSVLFVRKTRYNACEIVFFVRSFNDVNFFITTVVNSDFVTSQYSFSLFFDSI